VLILYLSFTACTSWRPDSLTPQAVVQGHPTSLRVTRTDSSQITLSNPILRGDTIVGVGPETAHARVPLDSVLLTDTRHGDAGKSLLVVLGVAVALVGVAGAYVLQCNCFDMKR